MRRLGIFLLVASCAWPLTGALAEADAPRQPARFRSATGPMVAPPRPVATQPRPQSARPAMQRPPIRQPQQRLIRPDGLARHGRMMDPEMSRPLRGRDFDGVRTHTGPGQAPRIINTAAADQPVQAPVVSSPRADRPSGDRADRMRDWMNRNPDRRSWDGRNRGGGVVAPRAGDLENQGGSVEAPTTDQQEGRRHSADGDRDGHRHGNRGGSWRDRHRDWHERHEGDPDFDRKHRRWHNREWYRRNYNRFVLFGGGYYYWNRGYWYPAYGYHPTYSSYVYDAPIYSYNGLPPGQVLAMVQTQLQQRGYYNAAVDGTYGPVTRQALLNFQADHGLPMTGQIDQETLLSLGFQ